MSLEFEPQSGCIGSYQTRLFDAMADALACPGWGVFPLALDGWLLEGLLELARIQKYTRLAKIGRRRNQRRNARVRLDRIVWIDGNHPTQQAWLDWVAELQLWLNRSLMLGLSFFESHYAHYPPGSFYKKHLDVFQGNNQQNLSNRAVSLVLYLNPQWPSGAGGELVLYGDSGATLCKITPVLGTLVLFRSADFVHEVLPTQQSRLSIAGWFHRQPASALALPVV